MFNRTGRHGPALPALAHTLRHDATPYAVFLHPYILPDSLVHVQLISAARHRSLRLILVQQLMYRISSG